jgi:hypothetical protein
MGDRLMKEGSTMAVYICQKIMGSITESVVGNFY